MPIKTKNDLDYYLKADLIAFGIKEKKNLLLRLLSRDRILKYQILLRKTEFYFNNKGILYYKILYYFYALRLRKQSLKLGFHIPINKIGPGLTLQAGPTRINSGAKIGRNCSIHVGVIIATKAGFSDKAPTIGDNVYIGPGAKLFGDIKIANNCAIGANAVVTKPFENENKVIAGVPAKEISDINIKDILIAATEIIDLKIPDEDYLGLPAKETSDKLKKYGY
ncbi:MAG: hypothetical protein KGZ85_08835 [Ignavibacterium sp.]|nr:hypothetical protein [Ignavibacterium sp.]